MPQRPPVHRNPLASHGTPTPRRRPSSSARGYGDKWKKARADFLRDNAHCAHCFNEGRGLVTATCVDHSAGHAADRANFWQTDTWVASCKSCNSRWAAKCEGGFGNPKRPRQQLHHLPPKQFRESLFL